MGEVVGVGVVVVAGDPARVVVLLAPRVVVEAEVASGPSTSVDWLETGVVPSSVPSTVGVVVPAVAVHPASTMASNKRPALVD